MISKFEPVPPEEQKHGSRLAIVFNGSPLFTGGAGSGESDIRKWIIENDWLEAIVALPEQMFYNTGIGTYIWIVTNRKEKRAQGQNPAVRRARNLHSHAPQPGRQAPQDRRRHRDERTRPDRRHRPPLRRVPQGEERKRSSTTRILAIRA